MGRNAGKPLIAAAVLVPLAGLLFPQDPVIRVEVRLVRLLVTVKDAAGQLIGSLDKSDFHIQDTGVRQDLAVFERHTEQPLQISLLVDISASTAKDLRYETESVARFLKAVFREGNPGDEVALYAFNYNVTRRSGFTRRLERLERELKQLKAEGSTALYDAIYLAGRDLEERGGRHVMVVVTDGGDTDSAKRFQDALKAAHRADAVFYSILVMPILNDAGRNIGGENALATLAAGTGGRVFYPSLGPGLDQAFDEILKDLRTQYLLAFYPRNVPPAKDGFHPLRISLSRPGLRAVARNGYYGDSDPGGGRPPQGQGPSSSR
ncbi:MAG: VWA domain-containing protein [Acidobacteria bacterium]|nr:VWA domain-containing protein [Acidobacteriota bacterium]